MIKKIILIVFVIISTFSLYFHFNEVKTNGMNNRHYATEDILTKYDIPQNSLPRNGIISNSKTARKVADIVLSNIYGNSIQNQKPFIVTFDKEYGVWIIQGQLKKNKLGGVAYIIIKKNNGKVLAIGHTK